MYGLPDSCGVYKSNNMNATRKTVKVSAVEISVILSNRWKSTMVISMKTLNNPSHIAEDNK